MRGQGMTLSWKDWAVRSRTGKQEGFVGSALRLRRVRWRKGACWQGKSQL